MRDASPKESAIYFLMGRVYKKLGDFKNVTDDVLLLGSLLSSLDDLFSH